MAGNRFRHFGIIFYGTQKELFVILHQYNERIAHYAFILHDKDVYLEDIYENDKVTLKHKKGDKELNHYHVIVDLFNGATARAVARLFKTETDNAKVEALNDLVQSYRYLTHKDNPEKYQYSSDSVLSDDIDYYEKLCIRGQKRDSDDTAIQIVEALLAGVNPRILMHRYGRDCIIHMSQYKDYAHSIQLWELENRWRLVEEKKNKLEEVYDDEQIPFEI